MAEQQLYVNPQWKKAEDINASLSVKYQFGVNTFPDTDTLYAKANALDDVSYFNTGDQGKKATNGSITYVDLDEFATLKNAGGSKKLNDVVVASQNVPELNVKITSNPITETSDHRSATQNATRTGYFTGLYVSDEMPDSLDKANEEKDKADAIVTDMAVSGYKNLTLDKVGVKAATWDYGDDGTVRIDAKPVEVQGGNFSAKFDFDVIDKINVTDAKQNSTTRTNWKYSHTADSVGTLTISDSSIGNISADYESTVATLNGIYYNNTLYNCLDSLEEASYENVSISNSNVEKIDGGKYTATKSDDTTQAVFVEKTIPENVTNKSAKIDDSTFTSKGKLTVTDSTVNFATGYNTVNLTNAILARTITGGKSAKSNRSDLSTSKGGVDQKTKLQKITVTQGTNQSESKTATGSLTAKDGSALNNCIDRYASVKLDKTIASDLNALNFTSKTSNNTSTQYIGTESALREDYIANASSQYDKLITKDSSSTSTTESAAGTLNVNTDRNTTVTALNVIGGVSGFKTVTLKNAKAGSVYAGNKSSMSTKNYTASVQKDGTVTATQKDSLTEKSNTNAGAFSAEKTSDDVNTMTVYKISGYSKITLTNVNVLGIDSQVSETTRNSSQMQNGLIPEAAVRQYQVDGTGTVYYLTDAEIASFGREVNLLLVANEKDNYYFRAKAKTAATKTSFETYDAGSLSSSGTGTFNLSVIDYSCIQPSSYRDNLMANTYSLVEKSISKASVTANKVYIDGFFDNKSISGAATVTLTDSQVVGAITNENITSTPENWNYTKSVKNTWTDGLATTIYTEKETNTMASSSTATGKITAKNSTIGTTSPNTTLLSGFTTVNLVDTKLKGSVMGYTTSNLTTTSETFVTTELKGSTTVMKTAGTKTTTVKNSTDSVGSLTATGSNALDTTSFSGYSALVEASNEEAAKDGLDFAIGHSQIRPTADTLIEGNIKGYTNVTLTNVTLGFISAFGNDISGGNVSTTSKTVVNANTVRDYNRMTVTKDETMIETATGKLSMTNVSQAVLVNYANGKAKEDLIATAVTECMYNVTLSAEDGIYDYDGIAYNAFGFKTVELKNAALLSAISKNIKTVTKTITNECDVQETTKTVTTTSVGSFTAVNGANAVYNILYYATVNLKGIRHVQKITGGNNAVTTLYIAETPYYTENTITAAGKATLENTSVDYSVKNFKEVYLKGTVSIGNVYVQDALSGTLNDLETPTKVNAYGSKLDIAKGSKITIAEKVGGYTLVNVNSTASFGSYFGTDKNDKLAVNEDLMVFEKDSGESTPLSTVNFGDGKDTLVLANGKVFATTASFDYQAEYNSNSWNLESVTTVGKNAKAALIVKTADVDKVKEAFGFNDNSNIQVLGSDHFNQLTAKDTVDIGEIWNGFWIENEPDWMGFCDAIDYFKFSVGDSGALKATLSGDLANENSGLTTSVEKWNAATNDWDTYAAGLDYLEANAAYRMVVAFSENAETKLSKDYSFGVTVSNA